MKLIKAFNIQWDTGGEPIDLPSEAFFSVDNDFDINEGLADLLSDEYNFCVEYAEYEVVAETESVCRSFLKPIVLEQ
jgi:hypothetical protein